MKHLHWGIRFHIDVSLSIRLEAHPGRTGEFQNWWMLVNAVELQLVLLIWRTAPLYPLIQSLSSHGRIHWSFLFLLFLNNINVLFDSNARYTHTAELNFGWLVTLKLNIPLYRLLGFSSNPSRHHAKLRYRILCSVLWAWYQMHRFLAPDSIEGFPYLFKHSFEVAPNVALLASARSLKSHENSASYH